MIRIGSKLAGTRSAARDHTSYRATRTVLSFGTPTEATMTVFVGLFNATPYLDNLWKQIAAQRGGPYKWFFADNDSSDHTWERVVAWAESTNLDVTLVKNSFNLGGTGSLFVNLDLVQTNWLTFMHQDDFYLPGHLWTLHAAVLRAPNDTVGVFSDMARARSDGGRIGAFPPLIWLVPDLDPHTLFLALLRNHPIPWPCIAVRTLDLRASEVPWHSTAFPDTEITMLMTARGRFVHVAKETMRYRDNAASESRSIDDRERGFASTISMFRVFNSDEFGVLARSLAVNDREAFADGIEKAVLTRFGAEPHSYLLIVVAWERLSFEWDNTEPHVLDRLSAMYAGIGASSAASLLARMSSAAGGRPRGTADIGISSIIRAPKVKAASKRGGVVTALSRLNERHGYRVPYSLRRFAARAVLRMATRNDPLSSLNYTWR